MQAPVQIRVEERCSPSSRSAGQRRSSGWLARRRGSCCRRSPRGHAHRRRALLLGEKDKLRLTGCTVKTVASLSAVQSPAVGTEQERRVGRGVERHEQERRVAAGTEQEQERRVRPLGPLNNPRSSWPAGKQRGTSSLLISLLVTYISACIVVYQCLFCIPTAWL